MMSDAEINGAVNCAAVTVAKVNESEAIKLLDAYHQLLAERNTAYDKLQRYYDAVHAAWKVAIGENKT